MGGKTQATTAQADGDWMLATSARMRTLFCLAVSAVAISCSQPQEPEVLVSQEDVVLAYVDEGVDPDVADCLVGLGSRDLEFDALLPGVVTGNDALLVDEMLRSCTDAVAILSEEDLEARQNFDTGPFNIGDDLYLDELWTSCAAGSGAACDLLWEESPVGSQYESFGVTCGNRQEILDCTDEMDGPDLMPEDLE